MGLHGGVPGGVVESRFGARGGARHVAVMLNGPQISMHNYAAAGPTQLVMLVGSVSRE